MTPSEEYIARLRNREAQVKRLSRVDSRIGTARLLLAIAIAGATWIVLLRHSFSLWWLLPPVAAFAGLVIYHVKVRRLLLRAQRAAVFYSGGLARIEDRWAGTGQLGERFADPHHVYSADLDLFGAASLFELLCVARTRMGEETLARWLLAPANLAEIKARQEAVTELRDQLDLREDLAILGEQSTLGLQPDALLSWASAPNRLPQRWLIWVAATLAVAAVIASLSWFITGFATPFVIVLAIEAGIVLRFKRHLGATVNAVETTFANLELLSNFLARVERGKFHAARLAEPMQALRSHNLEASRAIANLRAIVQRIESRRNIVMAVLDVPLMITVRAALGAEAWRRGHGRAIETWLKVVGDVEALLSIATYSYEHPNDPFPELCEAPTMFRAQGIAHPLLPAADAVRNDVNIDGATRLLLVSGSNMSGKSTLMRSVGINAVLAMLGAPVRAQRLQLSALQVGASIRVNDSLREGSSRFYAEIKRLRQLQELAGQERPLLMLLDELLQGTNSADRLVGAQGVLHALMDRGAIGLVSTHDLALTEIGGPNDARVTNVHFQDILENGAMRFDFRLRPGVVTKSNALELMRTIGLIVK